MEGNFEYHIFGGKPDEQPPVNKNLKLYYF
jgi:hypothetical protein